MRDPSQLLTPAQIADYCGVTAQTVNDWLTKGRLHANNEGPQCTVETSQLVNFMDQNHLAIPAELLYIAESLTQDKPTSPSLDLSQALKHALIVDSDRNTSRTIEAILQELGIGSLKISSTHEALISYREVQPALITLELESENCQSIDLIQEIRQTRTTKVLVISSQMPSALIKAKTAGADVIVTKPFDNDTLKRTVRILLDLKKDAD